MENLNKEDLFMKSCIYIYAYTLFKIKKIYKYRSLYEIVLLIRLFYFYVVFP